MIYSFKEYKKPEIISGHLNLGGKDPAGNEINTNSLYLTKNGKPYIGIMGEMHFSRVPREQWRKALTLMKEGGVTIVATYIIWIYHEIEEGKLDWTGDNDLRAFVKLAQELGLEVCIRVGPWCHGEVRNGGFPDWILEKNCELRTQDPEYMGLVRKWYAAISEQVKGLYYKDGGNITMCQLENEKTDDAEYLLALKKMAIEVGIDVPIFTVTGWNAAAGARIPVDDVIPTFGGYCDAPWDEGTEQLLPCPRYFFTGVRNDSAIGKDLIKSGADADGWQLPYERYPYGTCETGGGLMDTYHRRYKIHGMDVYAMTMIMFCEGANLLGYYMYHGGINKVGKDYTLQESKETNYPNDYPMISYDFQAPISSYEETRESYDLLNILHMFIHEWEDKLAHMTYVEADSKLSIDDTSSLRYGMRTDGESGFVFINHYQRLHLIDEIKDVVIDTGKVQFPPICVAGDICFFMPFNMDLGDGAVLKYATAQPICKSGNNWLFMEIPGVKPEYCFEDENKTASIITLSLEEAKRARKVDGRVSFKEHHSKTVEELIAATDDAYTLTPLAEPKFELPEMFAKELKYQNKPIKWYSISVDDAEGFVDIKLECDVMQLYADGVMIEDDFYHGMPWRLPKKLIFAKECYIVASDKQDYSYME